jgi:anti-sigma-K factor RskA
MDTEIYISSGILELYCAGALSEAEMREVERMASQFAAIKKEIQAIELALWSFNDQIFAGPHEQFKRELIAGIKINSPNTTSVEKMPETALNKAVEPETPSIEIPKELPVAKEIIPEQAIQSTGSKKKKISIGIFLVIILPILLAFGAFGLWNNWDALLQELTAAKKIAANAEKSRAQIDSNLKATSQTLDTLRNPDLVKITLSGMKFSPEAKAVIYWNKNTNQILLDPVLIPLEDKDHCYQLWAMNKGETLSLGTFSATNKNKQMLPMKATSKASVFLISLEPKNGSAIPNIAQLCLMSKE